MLGAHSDTRHSRIAVSVGEINIAVDKDVLVIRASSGKNERAQDYDLDRENNSGQHGLTRNQK